MWSVVSDVANVAQLVGFDAAGLIAKIRQAARTAQQNNDDCELLARRVDMLGELLPRLMQQDPEALRAFAGLEGTLSEAHDVVMSCQFQGRGRTYKFFTASRMADRFRDVNKKIDSYLSLIPAISYVGITRRLDANHATTSRLSQSISHLELGAEHREFTLTEIAEATNNFAVVLSDDADSGTKVYKGKFGNGPEVAVKRLNRTRRGAEDAFFKEQHILSPLRHDHIVRLLGTCADDGERMLVTQYMPKGSLYDHLHGRSHLLSSSSSPVTASWKTRVQVLLGAARAVEHLHCHAVPLIIHCNVASSNILLDAAWEPRLSGFGASLWQAAGVHSQAVEVAGGGGYADPEYCSTGRVRPASDVYGLGVVMLEVLTGQPPMPMVTMTLPSFALPRIQAGRLGEILDGRPAPQPTTWQQLQPMQLVANTAARCLCLHGDNRPAISDVVANLEQALRLIV